MIQCNVKYQTNWACKAIIKQNAGSSVHHMLRYRHGDLLGRGSSATVGALNLPEPVRATFYENYLVSVDTFNFDIRIMYGVAQLISMSGIKLAQFEKVG